MDGFEMSTKIFDWETRMVGNDWEMCTKNQYRIFITHFSTYQLCTRISNVVIRVLKNLNRN